VVGEYFEVEEEEEIEVGGYFGIVVYVNVLLIYIN